jgi:hypothetical protein
VIGRSGGEINVGSWLMIYDRFMNLLEDEIYLWVIIAMHASYIDMIFSFNHVQEL